MHGCQLKKEGNFILPCRINRFLEQNNNKFFEWSNGITAILEQEKWHNHHPGIIPLQPLNVTKISLNTIHQTKKMADKKRSITFPVAILIHVVSSVLKTVQNPSAWEKVRTRLKISEEIENRTSN